MRELTKRQAEILGFIRSFSQQHGLPPTVREIGERFKMTPRGAFDHLHALERKGALQRRHTTKRTSRVLTLATKAMTGGPREIPILGRIAAGGPLLSEENLEGSIPLGAEWLRGRGEECFALRVRGESMINAHIVEGDLVLVRRRDHAEPGDIVVALVDGEATVKRFLREGGRVVLKPEHPTMRPIVIKPGEKDVKILGRVVGVLREL